MKKIKIIYQILCYIGFVYCASSQKINRGEYFFDTDPGIGYGTPIAAFTTFNDSTLNLPINTSALAVGSHYLFMRFCNTSNVWGQCEGRQLYVYNQPTVTPASSPSVVAGEYFFDNDPGIGNGLAFPTFTAFSDATLTVVPNTATLAVGSHYLFTRFKDAAGVWSQYEGRQLYVYNQPTVIPASSPSVVTGEYFFDTDPGIGNATSIPSLSSFINATLNLSASSASSLSSGSHNLYYRFKDANNIWGHYEGRTFTVCAVVPISQFTVNNGCVGSSVTIVNSSTNAISYTWDINNDAVTDYTTSGNVSHMYSTTGTYTIKLTTTSSSGCTDVKTATISINPLPLITVSNGSVCAGKIFTMNPSGASTYSINGSVATNFTFSPSSNTNYSLTGTSSLGCVSSNTAVSAVSVYSLPLVSANNSSICIGQTFTLSPSGASSYSVNGSAVANFTFNPSTNTSYSLTGASSLGCVSSNTAVSAVTVYSLPIVSVINGSVCAGTNFTFLPSGAFSYSINGTSVNGFTINPSLTTNYSITGASASGCISSNTAVLAVSVYSQPIVSVNSGSVCAGTVFTMNPTGANTFSVNSSPAVNFTFNPTATTNYSVTGSNSLGCVSSNTAVSALTVYALPIVSINSGSTCNGQSFTITPNGASTYTFTGGFAVVNPTITTNYSVSGTSTAGCVSALAAVATVSVNSIPIISVNSGSICYGQSFTISPSGANTYTYSSGSAVVNPTITSNYSVNGTSSAGCVSTLSALSNVTVNAIPVISVNGGSICNGQSFTLIPNGASTYTYSSGSAVVSPTTNSNYSVIGTSSAGCVSALAAVVAVSVNNIPIISVNSGSICNGQSFTISPSGASTYTYSSGSAIVSPTSNSNYSVSGTSSVGCISALTAVSNVTVNSVPVISVNSGSICNGQSFTISPTGANTYTYLNGSSIISPTANTNYSVLGTSSLGCLSASSAVSSITVFALPQLTITSSNNLICIGESASLQAVGAISYTWNSVSNISNIVVSPTISTSYSLSGSSNNGCLANAAFTQLVDACIGIVAQRKELNEILIYPNPSNGEFVIEITQVVSIRIYDLMGKVILQKQFNEGKNKIDLTQQTKGIYFAEINQNGTQKTVKLLKE